MFRKSKKMHFIGIGGIGMSGIAEILINMGYEVSGSDLNESEQTRRLASLGATVFIGHFPSNINDYHVVVTSSAISQSNPELIEARKRRIPVIHRSEMLAELVRMKYGIGVAGTHGKTTITSMLSYVLFHGGMNPTAVVGGKVLNFNTNARVGEGDYIVFEADESDGSFLKLLPCIGIVSNIDADHLDYYKYFQGLKDAFLSYINTIPFYGYSVLCIDDTTVREILPKVERPYYTYGLSEDADFRAVDIRMEKGMTCYRCLYRNESMGEFCINQLGNHNAVNSLSVIAVALELGLSHRRHPGRPCGLPGRGKKARVHRRDRGHPGIRRLRPPSHGDTGHPGGGQEAREANRGGVPAAPVHQDPASLGRVRPVFRQCGPASPYRDLSGGRGSHRRRFVAAHPAGGGKARGARG